MKYYYQVMIVVLLLATLVTLGIIIASFFLPVYTLYMWIILFVLSASSLFGYVRLTK